MRRSMLTQGRVSRWITRRQARRGSIGRRWSVPQRRRRRRRRRMDVEEQPWWTVEMVETDATGHTEATVET